MNVADAAYNTVHDYPGGSPSLAPRMGISAQVLTNKVSLTQNHNKLTLDESVKLQAVTGDLRILHAMAAALGCVCVPAADFSNTGDMDLLDGFMSVIRELGELSAEFQADWSDGRITMQEFERIKTEAYDVQRTLGELLIRIEQLVEHPKGRQSMKAVA